MKFFLNILSAIISVLLGGTTIITILELLFSNVLEGYISDFIFMAIIFIFFTVISIKLLLKYHKLITTYVDEDYNYALFLIIDIIIFFITNSTLNPLVSITIYVPFYIIMIVLLYSIGYATMKIYNKKHKEIKDIAKEQ